ncbi:MAG: hypothetical protein JWQ40_2038 [Segetibacter sp.]|nr:hypothetical protein [Segetibacter sp.]
MKKLIILSLIVLSLTSCEKKIDALINRIVTKKHTAEITSTEFVKYTIKQGEQFCDKSVHIPAAYDELSFIVKFDSSAIYQTLKSDNQQDINKLLGFSDNNKAHHEFSARFGWRWSKNALRLFAYNYNNSVVSSKELGIVVIGAQNNCSIKVDNDKYIFTLNGKTQTMPRASTTLKAEGYKLYPYFGGDEFAPHTIGIWIKEK